MAVQKPSELKALLKNAEPQLNLYVSELEAQNLKLHRQIAKLQVSQVNHDNRIKALEAELKKGTLKVTIKRFAVAPQKT